MLILIHGKEIKGWEVNNMVNIHQLFEVVGASAFLIGIFFVTYAGLYDLCHIMDKSKARRIKRRELKQRKERLFKNNKIV